MLAKAKESQLRTGLLATLNDGEEFSFGEVYLRNNNRLRSTLGKIPPEECGRNYCARPIGSSIDVAADKTTAGKPGRFNVVFVASGSEAVRLA